MVALALQIGGLAYDIPLDAWVDLVYDRRWQLSTQTGAGLALDHLKSLVLMAVVNLLLFVPLYAVIRATDWWWLAGWLLVVVFTVGLGALYPVLIAPLFNRFSLLPAGELDDRIQRVARVAGVAVSGVYVADASRRSRRDNAYVAGLGRTRRIVLFDTLLEEPVEVVEQVVAHEIGHWQRRHLQLQVVVASALMLVAFVGLRLASEWTWLLDQAGVDSDAGIGDPASLPLVLLLGQIGLVSVGAIGAWVSRAFERQADLAALELLGAPDRLIAMHRQLHVKNLADLDPGWWRRLMATHPPAAERMAFAAAWDGTQVPPAV